LRKRRKDGKRRTNGEKAGQKMKERDRWNRLRKSRSDKKNETDGENAGQIEKERDRWEKKRTDV